MSELHLYEAHIGPIVKYAFGPDWVGMAAYMDDFNEASPEDAVLKWYHWFDPSAHDYFDHLMTDDELLDWYYNVWRKRNEHAS